MSLWGAPEPRSDEPATVKEPAAAEPEQVAEEEDPDKVDTAPEPVVKLPERDPLTDTGRHARIEINEPEPAATAFHLPLDDPNQAPEGYPIKANTKSGLYWTPNSAGYDEAQAEIWFASEEFAITNGFVRDGQPEADAPDGGR
jgi:uncharacterized protein with LGFP repeats